MAETHDLGRFYLTTMRYFEARGMPLVETGWSRETDGDYRTGRCLVFRIPFSTFGIVLGWWGPPGDEEETLKAAIGYRDLGAEFSANLMAQETEQGVLPPGPQEGAGALHP